MLVDIQKLLPIGSVIALKEAEKRLMICGIKQIDVENDIEYDYIGVVYPEGSLGQNMQFLFNHEDIETVFYLGYDDIERQIFISQLAEIYKTSRTENETESHDVI